MARMNVALQELGHAVSARGSGAAGRGARGGADGGHQRGAWRGGQEGVGARESPGAGELKELEGLRGLRKPEGGRAGGTGGLQGAARTYGMQGLCGAGAKGTEWLEGPCPPWWRRRTPPKSLPGVGQRELGWFRRGPTNPAPLRHEAYLRYSNAAHRVTLKTAPLEGAGGSVPTGLSPTEGVGGAPEIGFCLEDATEDAGEGVLATAQDENHPGGERGMLRGAGVVGGLAGQAPTGC